MELKKLIQEYLKDVRVMQLATCINNQPWACNLHFYSDENLNFYWISTRVRRHSQEIEDNPKVALVVNVHEDTTSENYIVGISIEGTAKLLDSEQVKSAGLAYANKLNKAPSLIEDIITGKNPHKFYVLKPSKIVLFDTKNFPDNPRQEMVIK